MLHILNSLDWVGVLIVIQIIYSFTAIPIALKYSKSGIKLNTIATITFWAIYFSMLKLFCDTPTYSFVPIMTGILLGFMFWIATIILSTREYPETNDHQDAFIIISGTILTLLTSFTLYEGTNIYYTKQWRPVFQEKIAQIEAGKVSYAISPKIPSDKILDYLESDNSVFARQIMNNGQLKEVSLDGISSITPFKVIGKENIKNVPYRQSRVDADKDVLFLCHIVNYSIDGPQNIDVVMGSRSYTKAVLALRKVNAKVEKNALQGLSKKEKIEMDEENEQIKLMISKEKN
mgnify:FL=1